MLLCCGLCQGHRRTSSHAPLRHSPQHKVGRGLHTTPPFSQSEPRWGSIMARMKQWQLLPSPDRHCQPCWLGLLRNNMWMIHQTLSGPLSLDVIRGVRGVPSIFQCLQDQQPAACHPHSDACRPKWLSMHSTTHHSYAVSKCRCPQCLVQPGTTSPQRQRHTCRALITWLRCSYCRDSFHFLQAHSRVACSDSNSTQAGRCRTVAQRLITADKLVCCASACRLFGSSWQRRVAAAAQLT